MKYFIVLLALVAVCALSAVDIAGKWSGVLNVSGQQLRVSFNIEMSAEGLVSTMDSPDQGAFGIPVDITVFSHPLLELEIRDARIQYSGELKDGIITGTFTQYGYEIPLELKRGEAEEIRYERPQEPREPYPYRIEEVRFANPEAGIVLAGTLTLPEKEGVYPAVVLISGSGPQDRDETVFGHKPFWIIADHLTRQGIAVLRFDDRGIGESEGNFEIATSYDFATDAASAVTYLKARKEIGRIGLAGHSEGGIIAPIVASRSSDVDFIILLAGTGIRGDQLLLLQQKAIYSAYGESDEDVQKTIAMNSRAFEMVLRASDPESLREELRVFLLEQLEAGQIDVPEQLTGEELIEMQIQQVSSPWMMTFLKLDPAEYLQKVKCPVLALNGAHDLQVPSEINLSAIAAALDKGGNQNYTTIEYPGLNHLFQESETGLPDEYVTIEQTFSPLVLEDMTAWILKINE